MGNQEVYIRPDGRKQDELREIKITLNWSEHAEGSALIEFGKTKVLCMASLTQGVPRWRKETGLGWVSAEYAMLPRATSTRNQRESVNGKISGRTQEISRLIGRSLRAIVDFKALGENTILIDCDVLQADGGTRTAAITGAYLALAQAIKYGQEHNLLKKKPILKESVSAISVGIIKGKPCLDLPYEEDSQADVDMNVVQTGSGKFIEVQGTGEGSTFSREELDQLLELATSGNRQLSTKQAFALLEGQK